MLKSVVAYGAAGFLMIGAARFITEDDAVLYVVVHLPVPDTTSLSQVGISGEVVGTPPKQAANLAVIVTGGARTAVDTASSMVYSASRFPC